MRGPCQLFDFTGARADQCLKLKYISEGEGSGPQQVRDRKLDEREVQSTPTPRLLEIQNPQVYFLDIGSQWPCEDFLALFTFLCFPLSPCQPATPEQRDARQEAGSERILGLRIVFLVCLPDKAFFLKLELLAVFLGLGLWTGMFLGVSCCFKRLRWEAEGRLRGCARVCCVCVCEE